MYQINKRRAAAKQQFEQIEDPRSYMAVHWQEIHEWLTFPRGLGVWSAVLIATFAMQPLLGTVVGLVVSAVMNALAIPLWEAGHEEGGLHAVHGDAKRWWRYSRPLRTVVAHWGFRWAGVTICLLVAWVNGARFDAWWLPLGLLLIYDVVRTLRTAENGPAL
jgi:hypothetical protein